MNDVSLDRRTAAMMYRAERLQEKGQLQQALRYFDRVLGSHPTCEEAAVNARMIREQLAEEGGAPRPLEPVTEDEVQSPAGAAAGPSAHAAPLQSTEMRVIFTRQDKEQWDCYWSDAALQDEALVEAARVLKQHGISTPFLQLVSFDVETYTPSFDEDPWMDNMYTCRGVVRVTFPPAACVLTTKWQPAAAPIIGSSGSYRA